MESFKLPQLRDKCIEYGLSKKGNKPELINRIQEYEKELQAAMALENQLQGGNLDDEEEESEEEENEDKEVNEDDELVDVYKQPSEESNNLASQNATDSQADLSFDSKTRTRSYYSVFGNYESHDEAKNLITEEFVRERLYDTTEGQKERWVCKHFGCARKCYILFTSHDESVSLWFNDEQHQHEHQLSPKKAFGINPKTKDVISKIFRSGTRTPGQVLSVLRIYQEPSIKDKHNQITPNPDYVEGLVLPTTVQIRNFIQNNLKLKESHAKFSYADLAKFVNEHLEIPENIDEPYVIDSVISVNDELPRGLYFIFFKYSLIG